MQRKNKQTTPPRHAWCPGSQETVCFWEKAGLNYTKYRAAAANGPNKMRAEAGSLDLANERLRLLCGKQF